MLKNIIKKNSLVLYDIDGTILSSSGVGGKSLRKGIFKALNIDLELPDLRLSGKTDYQIIREVMEELEIEYTRKTEDNILNLYLEVLQDELSKSQVHIFPGITESLDLLKQMEVEIGLLTGNVRKGAFIKLNAVGLHNHFDIGAFGSDDHRRNELVPIAIKKYADLNKSFDFENTWIIGDTPRDVECAKIHGAKCIAVATGVHSFEELKQTNADYVVHNLSELL